MGNKKTSEGLYIQMFSVHGLVRSRNLELGRDADTGGQVKYVIELGNALSQIKGVRRVDLFTRRIVDKAVSEDYGEGEERVNDRFRIVRIQCGGRKYMRKERLWPHLDEFVDKTLKYIKRQNDLPDLVHGHYPDAGYAAQELAHIFGIPFVYTGHSLGRAKRERLAEEGLSEKEMIQKYNIMYRIAVEEEILRTADLVITSTRQEIKEQYGMYENGEVAKFSVIPPGIDLNKFYPFYYDRLPETEKDELAVYARASMLEELNRFFIHPDRPLILALCRPDKRKNIDGLIHAYGQDRDLQAMANLAIFAGIRKDITGMEDNERDVLTQMLLSMDKYDLYGKMAIPKKHEFEYEVPQLYRIAASQKGVFVNSALTEPFGITVLEAAASGLPVIVTRHGGAKEIIQNCECGLLVDPTEPAAVADAIKEILVNPEKWDAFSKSGILNVRKHYSWTSHAKRYVKDITALIRDFGVSPLTKAHPQNAIGRKLVRLDRMLITDIDNTLLGGEEADLNSLMDLLSQHRDTLGFGVATGRVLESAVEVLKSAGVFDPDIIISAVGSQIHYGPTLHHGRGWETHIAHRWDRDKIVELLKTFDFLEYQEERVQRKYKISYNMAPGKDRLAAIHDILTRNRCHYNMIYSHEKYLDILPYRASKGKAIRYLSYKWEIPLQNFLLCGDSGNDEEMLRGEPRAVVVGNYSPELKKLKGLRNIYFAKRTYAGGILEAMDHYRFIPATAERKTNGASK